MTDGPITAEHVAVFGDSGTGKTTLLRSIEDNTDAPSLIDRDTSFEARRVTSYEGAMSTIEAGDSAVFDGDDPDRVASAMVSVARDHVGPVQLIFPEASEVLYQTKDEPAKRHNAVWWALTEGRDYGIKVVMDEQDPTELPYSPLKQVPYIAWVGAPAGFHGGFFGHSVGNWIPEGELPTENFQYVVVSKKGGIVWPPKGTADVPEIYA